VRFALVIGLMLAACSRQARHPAARDAAVSSSDPAARAIQARARIRHAKELFTSVEPRLWDRGRAGGGLASADRDALARAHGELEIAASQLRHAPSPPRATIRQLDSALGDLATAAGPVEGDIPYTYALSDVHKHVDFALDYIDVWTRDGYH
jgi:hypothetical protein